MQQDRTTAMRGWCDETLAPAACRYTPLRGDASFRRYFRVECGDGRNLVLMDSPPDRENPTPFVAVTQRLTEHGVRAPCIRHADLARGFLLLDDFGDELYLNRLDRTNVETLYRAAMDTLVEIQRIDPAGLPAYDLETMMGEMRLFTEWLLGRHLGVKLNAADARFFDEAFGQIATDALSQPQTFVHRDYHSRNLVVVEENAPPGVLDYQDAVRGPISYDLASLLRDCYVSWPWKDIVNHRRWFLERRRERTGEDLEEDIFARQFDFATMLRHFKAGGIFARLYHRDGKPGYLRNLPRTLGYIVEAAQRQPGFSELGERVANAIRRLPEAPPSGTRR